MLGMCLQRSGSRHVQRRWFDWLDNLDGRQFDAYKNSKFGILKKKITQLDVCLGTNYIHATNNMQLYFDKLSPMGESRI